MGELSKYHKIAEKSGRPGKLFAWIDSHENVLSLVMNVSAIREVSWNFRPMLDGRETVERRLPPQVDSLESALYWIAITHAFVHHCIHHDFDKDEAYPATLAQLQEAIQSYGQEFGLSKFLKAGPI